MGQDTQTLAAHRAADSPRESTRIQPSASLFPMRTLVMSQRVFAAGALLASSLLIGCMDSKNNTTAPGDYDQLGMITSIQVTPTQFKSGDNVTIKVVSRNASTVPVTLHFSSGCLQGFNVKNQAGQVVAPQPVACTANVSVITLKSGEVIDNTFQWNGGTGYAGNTKLPAGDYEISAHLNAAESSATSASVKVTILP